MKTNLQVQIEKDLEEEAKYWYESGEQYEYEMYIQPYEQQEYEEEYLQWYNQIQKEEK